MNRSLSVSTLLGLVVALILAADASAFQTTAAAGVVGGGGSRNSIIVNNHRARTVPGAHYYRTAAAALKMAGEKDKNAEGKISADGTFYDDEVDTAPVKDGISSSMKARLVAEASRGLDENAAQPNVILYISLAVAVLAALGGAGIFY